MSPPIGATFAFLLVYFLGLFVWNVAHEPYRKALGSIVMSSLVAACAAWVALL